MPVSRRDFLRGSPATRSGMFIAARGLEAHFADEAQGANGGRGRALVPPGVEIRISSNENPLGPGKAVLDAILMKFPEAGRYPFNSTPNETALVAAIAGKFAVKPENIVAGAGSQEILKSAVRAFTTRERGLVTASPSFENCPNFARRLEHPDVREHRPPGAAVPRSVPGPRRPRRARLPAIREDPLPGSLSAPWRRCRKP